MAADGDNVRSDEPPGLMQFSTTQWSVVLAAGQRDTVESNSALERLCRSYWPPLYAYVRRRVTNLQEAQDLTQAFFERMLEREYLKDADPQRGRFRSFLLTAFKHFLSNEWEKARTQKRGGRVQHVSFDFDSHSAALAGDELTPEKIFEREWAVTLLARVMHRLQRDMERRGHGCQFELLKQVLNGESPGVTFADAAAELGQSESATRMAASRMRQRYRELLREEIAQTLTSKDDIDDEIRSLFAAF
jgi:RNA polymerase sigma-70 factor (ECF subfamily)